MKYLSKVICRDTQLLRFLRSNPICVSEFQPALFIDNARDTGGPWLVVPQKPPAIRPREAA